MNCTVCGKDVNEHKEGRSCDRCVAEKLGWNNVKTLTSTYGLSEDKAVQLKRIPHYSSPTMSAETWGLTEKLGDSWSIYPEDNRFILFMGYEDDYCIKASTVTLVICRAFLTKEEDNGL